MKTACYQTETMNIRDEYLDLPVGSVAYIGIEAIDAPEILPSGCCYSYEFYSAPGTFMSMPGSWRREQ